MSASFLRGRNPGSKRRPHIATRPTPPGLRSLRYRCRRPPRRRRCRADSLLRHDVALEFLPRPYTRQSIAKATSTRNMDVPPMENRTRSDIDCLAIAGAPDSKSNSMCKQIVAMEAEFDECDRARMVVTAGAQIHPRTSAEAAMSCTGRQGAETNPLKFVMQRSITRLRRVQPGNSLPTQLSENISTWKSRGRGRPWISPGCPR